MKMSTKQIYKDKLRLQKNAINIISAYDALKGEIMDHTKSHYIDMVIERDYKEKK